MGKDRSPIVKHTKALQPALELILIMFYQSLVMIK